MPTIVNVHEAKTHLSRLLERVKAGEEIILAKAGKPYAKLVPIARPERKLGFVEGSVPESFFEPLSEEELEAWG
jgi:prevent-host-death family protein